MRTLIWSSTAMVLLVGGGFFLAAQHAARYPDSYVGRCARTVYQVCNPVSGACAGMRPAERVANDTQPVPSVTQPAPAPEVVESIVVEPTEQEPPLGLSRLSPEIAAAIERLRHEEESEDPAQPFDGGQTLRMPYADEEAEVLPEPTPEPAGTTGALDIDFGAGFSSDSVILDIDGIVPETTSFFFLPPPCWQMVYDNVVESIRKWGEGKQGSEEPADQGTGNDESSDMRDLQSIPYEHYHRNACPYTGGCPSPSHYRYVRPVTPVPTPVKKITVTPRAQ